jgi:hypothetical protein
MAILNETKHGFVQTKNSTVISMQTTAPTTEFYLIKQYQQIGKTDHCWHASGTSSSQEEH